MRTSRWLVCVASIVAVFDASACGPDFPLMLTKCRSRCLSSITAPEFVFNALRVGGSGDPRLPGREGEGPTTAELESQGVGAYAEATLAAMRNAASGDEAYELGKDLPVATRLYTAGAVDFNHAHQSRGWSDDISDGDTVSDLNALTAALGRFQQILQLPADQARPRILWATYMLARCHELQANPGDLELAFAGFQQVTEWVRAGADDPMGLGHAALGEAGHVAIKLGHLGQAVKLFAEQAAAPDAESAIESLRRATEMLLMSKEPLDPWVRDPVTQKALIAYAVSSTPLYYTDNICIDGLKCADDDANEPYEPPIKEAAIRLVEAIDRLDVNQLQWPDQFAGLAYKLEKYEAVTRALTVSNTPYADWIRAKMALHAGDLQAAAAAFARASKGFSTHEDSPDSMPDEVVRRFEGERGLTSLIRSDYIEAFEQLRAGGYKDDALYVAERVLTVEELRRLVDKQHLDDSFRDLLARRLTRTGHYPEALVYYKSDSTRELAKKYAEYLQQAKHGASPRNRAAALYGAARLEFESGMQLIGAERCPDYQEYGGQYGDSCWQDTTGDLNSADEDRRLTDNAVNPDFRFHYRLIGFRHLMKAADELPPRTATFDAVLCQTVHLLQHHGRTANEELIHKAYYRYVHQGRAEPWATDFGAHCPEPEFE